MLIRQSSGPGSGNGPALPELHRRLKWVALIGIGALVVLIGRLWQLQVMRGESYYERTVSNVVKERYLPSVRGKIVDRNGVPLADNRPAFNLYATPRLLTRPLEAELSRMLGLSDDEVAKIEDRLAIGKKRDPRAAIMILEDQGRDRAALIEQSLARLPGVEVHHEPYRFYPQGELAAHLIGYMTQMTAAEADRLGNQGYDPSELVGRYGLEDKWENYLRGKKGIERYAVDARGQRLDDATASALIQGERGVPAVPGANLVLTIDAELQRLAERAVSHAAASAVVVVEAKTGRLRAVVSKPSFDPNIMTGHLTQAEETMLKQDPRKPFIDKAIRMTYPPGSIFKFTTAIAALEDGQAAEDENMFCTGEYQLSGTTFRCHGTHGKVDLIKAIQHSCDTYFWKLAERIGIDRIAEVAAGYGLGRPTNLGLNGDAGGRIPTKDWYEKTTRYKVGYATNASIGQGDVEVTVLQMAMAYAALANGGTLYVPQVVDRIEAHDGHAITSYEPKIAKQVKTPADALDIWKRGMWKVTNEPGGTAYDHGHTDVVTVMGKTGTAEVKKHHKQDDERELDRFNPNAAHAWFAGWAPAEEPEIAIVVLVEHGGAGGTVAWPIAKQILEGYFTRIKAPPQAPVRPPVAPIKEGTP
ncbi:MAG TPA: penicillin-binding protein 2 [Kofleriaceae bacterium]|jgi:penicillin-binding protein 2|nr:penicillin-binding protein 2 [Kofleriaceae bacterium]